MALLSDLEPPSSAKTKETNHKKISSKLIQKITNYPLKHKLVFFVGRIINCAKAVSVFYRENSKFLPHAAILLLLAVVLIANLTQSARASSVFVDFTAPNPDEELAVVSEVDQFTPLINNDSKSFERYLTVQSNADGFASNIAPVTSQITLRTEPLPDNSSSEIAYAVRSGDTLSQIAMEFNVKTATLKYVNNLDSADAIKLGMKLTIPQRGYEVSTDLIAKRENQNAAKKLALASRNTVAREKSSTRTSLNIKPGSSSNAYPYGWCTYYVATRRYVPGSWGNAKSWLSSARRDGYSTGRTPVAGAIMVSAESWLGHVAYVESVNSDGTFTIAEMNAKGWGVISSRKIRSDYSKVMGFVY